MLQNSPAPVPRAPRVRRSTEPRPPRLRSAVTNGNRVFVEGDGTSAWTRRRRDLEELYADDLGGALTLTGFQLGLIQTAATIRIELEALEGMLSAGARVDLDQYSRIAGHYRRICETLGLERRARDITPSLSAYLANKPAKE